MPVYEFHCPECRATASLLVRGSSAGEPPNCARCGGPMQRLISPFAFHRSLQSRVEQLDPKYDKMIDASNPDLASDRLIKGWELDKPLPEDEKRALREKMGRYPD